MKRDMEKIKKVYSLLTDKKSRDIFENALLYHMTGDYNFIKRMIRMHGGTGGQINHILNETSEYKAIFGAGITGKIAYQRNSDTEFACFIDNYKCGSEYNGLPVLSPNEFKDKYGDGIVIIPETKMHLEMYNQLIEIGFNREKIIDYAEVFNNLVHSQYFDLPQLKERRYEKEIFVDGGAYDGTSSLEFINWCGDDQKKSIYVWEPDAIAREICSERLKETDAEYKIISKGLWDKSETLRFDMLGNSCSSISEKGEEIIEADSIDHVIKEPVTFIKMDIEGSEYHALLGAKNMIIKHKPRLAISVYHKPEDLWELPYLIYELNPTYEFYLRHYSLDSNEVVLYAI